MSVSEVRGTIGVLAVDDQALFRSAAMAVVDATPGFEVVGAAASGAEALRLTAQLRPDLVLLDVRMPGMDGVETARRLVAGEPGAVVVLVSLEDSADVAALAQGCGAVAFVAKERLCPALLASLWDAHGHRLA
jgi:DNA-binding NarL/FixJ family response regulator